MAENLNKVAKATITSLMKKQKQFEETFIIICLFKKLLFTMENATAADSSQSNISRIYI